MTLPSEGSMNGHLIINPKEIKVYDIDILCTYFQSTNLIQKWNNNAFEDVEFLSYWC
jgi:hypothetical protein